MMERNERKHLLIVSALLIILLVVFASHAEGTILTTEGYHNGGSCLISSEQWYESGTNLMQFGAVNGTYNYGAATTKALTLGRSGYMRQSDSGDGFYGQFDISTEGMLNAFDTGAMVDIMSYKPESACDQDGFLDGVSNGSPGRYPASQSVDYLSGTMSSGPGTRYQSTQSVDETTLTYDYQVNTPVGYHMTNLMGSYKSGKSKNESTLNFDYGVHEFTMSSANESAPLDSAFSYSWNGYIEPEEEEPYTMTSISAARLDEFVNQTVNQTAEE